jgi:hypothetical protein
MIRSTAFGDFMTRTRQWTGLSFVQPTLAYVS